MQTTIIERITYSTARIESFTNYGGGSGSGFFFKLLNSESSQYSIIYITNKHVIADSTSSRITLSKMITDFTVTDQHVFLELLGEENWVKHPDNSVDLAAINITNLLATLEQKGVKTLLQYMDISMIPTDWDDFEVDNEILMIGYATGLWNNQNNRPIIKQGITATNPRLSYNKKNEFVIDITCFPGSSGSPIVGYQPGGRSLKEVDLSMAIEKFYLLGILYGGPEYNDKGEITITPIPIIDSDGLIASSSLNLGYAMRADSLLELFNVFYRLFGWE